MAMSDSVFPARFPRFGRHTQLHRYGGSGEPPYQTYTKLCATAITAWQGQLTRMAVFVACRHD